LRRKIALILKASRYFRPSFVVLCHRDEARLPDPLVFLTS
jgi:hypothetical protein